ncbi:MAG: hypothetical protein AABW93_03660 [Nanoarchaeota archaeon]
MRIFLKKNSMKRINIFLSDIEEKNLRALLQRYGGRAPAYFKLLLANAYKEEFGKYNAKSKQIKPIEEVISDEQYCEMLGGRVGKNSDGNPVCVKGTWSVPLDRRDLMKSRFKE